jgi:hypothetical protein
MTSPLRRLLLNAEIAREARRIAHTWTPTCQGEDLPDGDEHHTSHCNLLKFEVELLARIVKRAGQPEGAPQND